MHVDRAIQEAIRLSVRQRHQADTVSEKLIKWLGEVISGNESIDSVESVYRRIDNLLTAVEVDATQNFLPLSESIKEDDLSSSNEAEREEHT